MDPQHETLNRSRQIFKNNEVICHFSVTNLITGPRTSIPDSGGALIERWVPYLLKFDNCT